MFYVVLTPLSHSLPVHYLFITKNTRMNNSERDPVVLFLAPAVVFMRACSHESIPKLIPKSSLYFID